MYSSFLSSVLNKQKQAALIKSRAIGIDSSRTVSDENYQLGMFLDKTATLLISAGAKNFGIIVHANEEASAILKVPLNDLTGMSLNSFIPTPINLYHENYMKDFASTMIDPEVIKGKNLYFQDNSGRLIGVSLKVRLTALDKQLLYIANFHKKNAERDICLTAEDGTVYNYTELFPYCLGISQSNIVNQSIYDYLPELLSQEMTPSMFITTKNFKEIAILQKIILMNKTPIRLISVMQDTSVVKKIKSKLDLDD